MKKNTLNQDGFSLIELSIMLAVFSVLMASILNTKTFQLGLRKYEMTESRLNNVETAIQFFFINNGYLPCPASLTDGYASATYGTSTDCTDTTAPAGTFHGGAATDAYQIRIGSLPTRLLGLSDKDAIDGWNNRYRYVIIRQFGIDSATYDTYAASAPPPADAAPYFQIDDETSTATYNAAGGQMIGYIIFSHGDSGRGAYSKEGVAGASCNTSHDDGENCNNDELFTVSPMNEVSGTAFYDDQIRWMSKDDLDAL